MPLIPPSPLNNNVAPAVQVRASDPPDDSEQELGTPAALQIRPAIEGVNAAFETYLAAQAAHVVNHPARPGEAPHDSLVDREHAALRLAEAAERSLIQKEMLARIPVPIEAIPKLSSDLEQLRKIEQDSDQTTRSDCVDQARYV